VRRQALRLSRISCQLNTAMLTGIVAAASFAAPPRAVASLPSSSVAAPAALSTPVTTPTLLNPGAVLAAPQAIAEQIRKAARGKLKPVYAARNFAPLWAASGNIGIEAGGLIHFLSSADLDGLNSQSYPVSDLQRAIAEASGGDPKKIARAEVQLSRALSRYSVDLRKLPKSDASGMIYADPLLRPQKPREEAALQGGTLATNFPAYISGMAWMSPHYLRMRTLLWQAQAQGKPEDFVSHIRLSLERARFLPGPWTHHVVVDAASGRLWYYQAGRQAGTMRVVVGKQTSPTPLLAGMLHYAIVNPYWNVPTDLAQTNTAPKVLAGRTLKSMNMEVLSDWTDTAHALDPATIDWHAVAAGTQEIRVRQRPGLFNSMGKVKYLFPNELGIYLHDTPERELLTKEDRHFSNGCIRLEDAPGLGRWLLGRPLREIDSGQPEQVVPLPLPVPVYISYFTATEGADGGVALVSDTYGRDSQMAH
jgi:murein L,D-transpeptidase YcbB/YkuD